MNNEVNNLEGVTGEVILKVGTSHINKSHQLGASQIESIDSSPIFLFIYLFIYLFFYFFIFSNGGISQNFYISKRDVGFLLSQCVNFKVPLNHRFHIC